MHKFANARIAALSVGVLLAAAASWVVKAPAWAQDAPEASKSTTQRELVQKVLHSFAEAVVANDVEAALKLLPTEDDLSKVLGPANAARSASELRSHIKLNFHEFVDALKAFGKADLVIVEPGNVRRMQKGEGGAVTDTFVAENGYLSFVRDGNYFVELRFNVGGMMRINKDRWVITNMLTRTDRFPNIDPSGG